ncbi:MAG: CdaR family protein [Eubacterium sp.]|nr:CdaR family protein [Eubacterium sp.]MCM1213776.1 CdaR family protein [Lachnospiraceae bacterium]MCM1303346.1 CdaR family protein [Butyrivibrio sp.]MCM1342964.1 CdaR family protein [Muribaculaceae bacterium]MCM1237895.1 CdaR family protein [Lachnospiraceae bacterium]
MRKKVFHNWGLKLASLLLAAILWFLVVQLDDPKKSQTFYNIPVTLVNTELLEQEDKFYEVLDNTDSVRVTVTAPTSIIGQLRATDIVAEANVSRLTDINTIPITYSILNVGIDSGSVKGDHDTVRLNIEQNATRWVKVQYTTAGEVAEGYIVANASADQTMIRVSGPKSVVDRIDHAGVEIDVSGATSSLSANVEVLFYDSEDVSLESSNLVMDVNYVHMSVEVLAAKPVPVEVAVSGTPAAGFLATGEIQCEPAMVRVAGTTYALNNFSRIVIPEEQMNLDGAEGNVINVINIRELLPDNIRLADSNFNGRVTITAFVEPESERTLQIPAEHITVTNVPEALTAELSESEEYYEVKISGLEAVVSATDQSAIAGTVDVQAWMDEEDIDQLAPGIHEIPISFGIANEVKIDGEVTARVTFARVEE